MQLGLEDSRRTSVVNIGSVMNSANGCRKTAITTSQLTSYLIIYNINHGVTLPKKGRILRPIILASDALALALAGIILLS